MRLDVSQRVLLNTVILDAETQYLAGVKTRNLLPSNPTWRGYLDFWTPSWILAALKKRIHLLPLLLSAAFDQKWHNLDERHNCLARSGRSSLIHCFLVPAPSILILIEPVACHLRTDNHHPLRTPLI